jgi:hypothetical protein
MRGNPDVGDLHSHTSRSSPYFSMVISYFHHAENIP